MTKTKIIFISEASKTFIDIDSVVLFQCHGTVVNEADRVDAAAWVVMKNNSRGYALTLPPPEMERLWRMISANALVDEVIGGILNG